MAGLALATAGCGGDDRAVTTEGPKLDRQLVEDLADTAERRAAVADNAVSTARCAKLGEELQQDVVDAVNRARVEPRLQEELMARANELAEERECTGDRFREFAEWLRENSA